MLRKCLPLTGSSCHDFDSIIPTTARATLLKAWHHKMGVRTICVKALFDLDAFVLSRPWLYHTNNFSITVCSNVVEDMTSRTIGVEALFDLVELDTNLAHL